MENLKDYLDREARRINNPDFIAEDPVQFPRMFERVEDIEIASFLCSTIAWGNRRMICRDCQKMMGLLDWQPYNYVMDGGYEELPEMNVHRTFFTRNMRYYLRGLHRIYLQYGSLQGFAAEQHIADRELPSWALVDAMNRELAAANDGVSDNRCLPLNLKTTALKRVNMALRWLVRDDGIVDMGVWSVLKPSQLFIPLDVHVGNISRELGLLTRCTDDKRAVLELTERLRAMRPEDPVFYDYALFGIGVNAKKKEV